MSFMKLEDAIELVVALARENVLQEQQCDDEQMLKDRGEQVTAIDTVEDYFINNVFGGASDEIHDENLKEFVDAMGVCAEAITVKPQLEFYSGVVWEYENEILPLRADADEGVGDYNVYDEAFDEMLEGLFEQVKTEAALLDSAPLLLKACKMLLASYGDDMGNDGVDWEDLDAAVKAAREAVAEAEKVPAS